MFGALLEQSAWPKDTGAARMSMAVWAPTLSDVNRKRPEAPEVSSSTLHLLWQELLRCLLRTLALPIVA